MYIWNSVKRARRVRFGLREILGDIDTVVVAGVYECLPGDLGGACEVIEHKVITICLREERACGVAIRTSCSFGPEEIPICIVLSDEDITGTLREESFVAHVHRILEFTSKIEFSAFEESEVHGTEVRNGEVVRDDFFGPDEGSIFSVLADK